MLSLKAIHIPFELITAAVLASTLLTTTPPRSVIAFVTSDLLPFSFPRTNFMSLKGLLVLLLTSQRRIFFSFCFNTNISENSS